MDEIPADGETHTFLSTQFFFYMLPCYVAIGSFAYRYYTIIKQEPVRNVSELPGEVMVTCLEEDYGFDAEDTVIPPASYVLKSRLSLMNCYTYLGMVLLGLLGDPDIYYSAQHRTYSLLYAFGMVAWGMSALLLRREFQRAIGQSLWTHRFFWIFAGTFSVTKMFEDYLLPLNIIINVVFIASNLMADEDNGVLAMYAMYRPDDREDNYLQMNDMPGFARIFFQKLELNEIVRKLFRIENQPLKLNVDELTTNEEDITKDLQAFKTTLTSQAKTVAEGIDLLNRLPRRNIIVNNRVRIKKINDIVKYYFVLITQIGDSRFEAERKFSEFVDLENSLSVHFSEKNFPKLRLPRLRKAQFNNIAEGDSSRRAELLQEWLKGLLNNPIFLIDPTLKFLNIDEENSAPFLTYYNISYPSLCSEIFLFNAFRQKKQIEFRQQRISVWGVVEETQEDLKSMAQLIHAKMEFEVVPDEESVALGEYRFALTCKTPKRPPIRWTLSKVEEQFAVLNERVEEQTDSMVPIYYQSVLRIPQFMRSKSKVTREKLEAYGKYLQRLLDSSQYYTFALFEFIMFDPVKLEPVHDRSNLAALHARETLSLNKLAESYHATEADIQVLRIRVSEKDGQDGQPIIKMLLRKKTLGPFVKTAQDLVQLRSKIVRIYKGIASVPELYDFSRRPLQSELRKVKLSVENFLQTLESLPQIQNNQSYLQFYVVDANTRFSEGSTAEQPPS